MLLNVCLCRQGGEEHVLEYVLVVGLGLSTKGEDLKKKSYRASILVLIDQTEKHNQRCRWNECRNFIFAEVIDQNNLWTIIYLLKIAF